MMRTKFTLIPLAAVLCALSYATPASAQIELFASTPNGAATDFVLGASNIVSLRGTLDAPSGGQTLKVRQVDSDQSCPTATGNTVPIRSTFTAYVGSQGELPKINVSSAIDSSARTSRFCIYAYYDVAPGGEANPNTSYSQLITFRDAADSFNWFDVASATSPELPYFAFSGHSETRSAILVSFVPQRGGCPATFPGGPGAINFGPPSDYDFLLHGQASVAIGFWRACGYFQVGSTTVLGKDTKFSRAPRGGWRPGYNIKKGTLRAKRGAWSIGTASCPGTCRISIVAKKGSKILARGSSRGGRLSIKANAAGRKAAKRGVKARVTLTSTIDQSIVSRSAKVTLR